MEKLKKILNTTAIIMSGITLASLCITHSDNWKYSLPICLLCLSFSQSLDNK